MFVSVVARAGGVAGRWLWLAWSPTMDMALLPPSGSSGASAAGAKRPPSRGRPAGRVAEMLCKERLGQQDRQQMAEDVHLGQARVLARRARQPDAALGVLEGDLDAPAQAVEVADLLRREFLPSKRGDKDRPACRDQRGGVHGLAFAGGFPLELGDRLLRGMLRLAQRHEANGDGLVGSALHEASLVDELHAAGRVEYLSSDATVAASF